MYCCVVRCTDLLRHKARSASQVLVICSDSRLSVSIGSGINKPISSFKWQGLLEKLCHGNVKSLVVALKEINLYLY